MRDSDLEKIALAMRRKDVSKGESIIRQVGGKQLSARSIAV